MFDVQSFNYNLGCATHTFQWNFGDGTVDGQKTVSHAFSQPGNYRVSCNVSNGAQTVTLSQNITISSSQSQSCRPGSTTLCLNNGRFKVGVNWRDYQGQTGQGQAVPLTNDTGYFWFFSPNNVELVLKVLNGTPLNGKYWVFYGALTSVEYTITVTDTVSGATKTYFNPSGTFASRGDTDAFPASTQPPVVDAVSTPIEQPQLAPTGCVTTDAALCLNSSRFRVSVRWKDFSNNTGEGHAVSLTTDTGYFWFFGPNNVELVLKVLDGRGLNGSYWVFYGALSNVEYTITVTDMITGAVKTYFNPSGNFASRGDTEAFHSQ